MNEADTRAELIDPQLLEAGWKTDSSKGVRVRREYPINDGEIRAGGIRTGKLIADYILEYKNIKLAVIEAKSDEKDVAMYELPSQENIAEVIVDASSAKGLTQPMLVHSKSDDKSKSGKTWCTKTKN